MLQVMPKNRTMTRRRSPSSISASSTPPLLYFRTHVRASYWGRPARPRLRGLLDPIGQPPSGLLSLRSAFRLRGPVFSSAPSSSPSPLLASPRGPSFSFPTCVVSCGALPLLLPFKFWLPLLVAPSFCVVLLGFPSRCCSVLLAVPAFCLVPSILPAFRLIDRRVPPPACGMAPLRVRCYSTRRRRTAPSSVSQPRSSCACRSVLCHSVSSLSRL